MEAKIQISLAPVRAKIYDIFWQEMDLRWTSKDYCKVCRTTCPYPDNKNSEKLLKRNRNRVKSLIVALTENCLLREHSKSMATYQICRGCDENFESREDFLFHYPALKSKRFKFPRMFFGSAKKPTGSEKLFALRDFLFVAIERGRQIESNI